MMPPGSKYISSPMMLHIRAYIILYSRRILISSFSFWGLGLGGRVWVLVNVCVLGGGGGGAGPL